MLERCGLLTGRRMQMKSASQCSRKDEWQAAREALCCVYCSLVKHLKDGDRARDEDGNTTGCRTQTDFDLQDGVFSLISFLSRAQM